MKRDFLPVENKGVTAFFNIFLEPFGTKLKLRPPGGDDFLRITRCRAEAPQEVFYAYYSAGKCFFPKPAGSKLKTMVLYCVIS